ncbi:hypothetical protein C8R46DRAFT_76899 [Mycena filopes]|nr:hypothetical protein C8R46DRAFT_76899 [Mycena filopes]
MPAELHSIYDLTTFCRKTTGDVPAKLVGASTTVVGSKMYLFGGRLVTERRMVADLYVFDLETYNWEKITPYPDDDVPRARYFHSVDTWNNQLIVFGGMSNEPDSPNPDELCVLNDVRFFDIASRRWLPPSRLATPENLLPRARYAQLSSVTGDRLFIIGGQDFYNTWLDDVCVYDLLAKTWSEKRDYPRHCGSYRSVAVSSNQTVRFPKEEMRAAQMPSPLGAAGMRFKSSADGPPPEDITPSESLIHLPYSAAPNDEHPSDIYLYSNYNFTDVKRELELFSPLPDTGFTISDRSAAMSGTTFPPGLRFPTGAILGTHLIIAGIYLAHSYQSFSIWVLDLQTMVWSRIDPGKAVEAGSWFRGCLWPEANKFMIFGNRNGNLVDDYNRRLLSWDHVAVVDLEAFGIYQPPPLKLDIPMQELGLAALEEGVLADFEIVCDDGRKIGCSRRLLEERWPWFKEQRLKLLRDAMGAMDALPSSAMHIPLPDLPGNVPDERRPDPRLTPRAFNLSEPYPITLALLQYFYSMALLTPLQTAPAVLSQLLVLATNYRITHLQTLVRHAMHRALSNSTSVGVYEVATLCSCRSLQIRALKTVMSYTQKKPTRVKADRDTRGDKNDGGGGSSSDRNNDRDRDRDRSDRDGSGGGGGNSKFSTRPRGTSDARWGESGRTGGGGGSAYNNYSAGAGTAYTNSSANGNGNGNGYRDAYALAEEFADEEGMDQLFTLPVFKNNGSANNGFNNHAGGGSGVGVGARAGAGSAAQRHGRTDSVVSVRTENEINELIELMSGSGSSPVSPASSSSSSAARRPSAPASRGQAQMTDQMILDAMYHSLVGKHNDRASEEDVDDSEDTGAEDGYDQDESSYFPSSSSRASVAYESEEEREMDSFLASPTSGARQHNNNNNASDSNRAAYIPYHLPRRTVAPIDTTSLAPGAHSRGSTPSLMSSSSKSSMSSRASASTSPRTPPLSPESASGHALPSIEERFNNTGRGGGLAYDDDEEEDDDEAYAYALGLRRGYAREGRPQAPVHPRDGAPWPTQKSRVEWKQQTEMETDTGITTELREAPRTVAPAPATPTRTRRSSSVRRAVSPTPSDAETLSPRASGTFVTRMLAKKLGPTSPTSPTSPMSPRSPLSQNSHTSELFMDAKAQKAEQKRRKKEKMEELARTLKEKAKKAKEDGDRSSSKSKERMAMMEPVSMFGGFGMKM